MGSFGCRYGGTRCIAVAVLVGAAFSTAARAQSRVVGRVVKPGGDSVVAVPGAWVTLHRVGTDHAGPLDSTRATVDGRYVFNYSRTGADDAIYFASSSHGGVAYFTNPLHAGEDQGDDTEITVFDTTSRVTPMSVRGRHLVVSRVDPQGNRIVTEVFDLSNDTSVTRVARNDGTAGAVWASILPSEAKNPLVAGGDIPAAAVRFADGRALVYAPFAPGIKQLAYRYTIDEGAFPLRIPVQRPTSVLEVLLEEATARVDVPGLRQMPPVAVEGRDFRRFIAQDIPAASVLVVHVPKVTQPLATWFAAGLTLVIGGAMTWALARALRHR